MTKKRLSDILRENKPLTPDDPTADSIKNAPATASSDLLQPTQVEASGLEAEIAQLSKALAAKTDTAETLQNRVTSLESELEGYKKLVETLEGDLKQSRQLQKALDKQTTLVQKLKTELAEAQSVQTELAKQKQLVHKLQAELEEAKKQQPLESSSNPKELSFKKAPVYLSKRPIGRFVARELPPTVLSNEEIGWFD